jgi:hypothetical protein
MEGRFFGLQDDPDDLDDDLSGPEPSASDPLSRLSPRYSIDDVLRAQRSWAQLPPPLEIQRFENVYVREFQTPESVTFRPPTSDINSAASYGTKDKGQQRPYQQPNVRRAASPRSVPPPRPKKPAPPPRAPDARDEPEPPGPVWFYQDPFSQTMGPYTSRRMREWFTKKYFDGNLQIAGSEAGPFQVLSAVFPDQAVAFNDDGPQGGKAVSADGFEDRGRDRRLDTLVSFSVTDADDFGASWATIDFLH